MLTVGFRFAMLNIGNVYAFKKWRIGLERVKAKVVYKGIAYGRIYVMRRTEDTIKRAVIEDPETETERLGCARKLAQQQLQQLYERALKEVGEDEAAIFEAHQMLLADEDYVRAMEEVIRTGRVNAEYAVSVAEKKFATIFTEMSDPYMQAKAEDIKDVSKRIIGCLTGGESVTPDFTEPVILVADELTPSETVMLDKSKILAFVTVHGSAYSHTAILAKTMNIPALYGTGVDLKQLKSGTLAIVDGISGELILNPTDVELERTKEKQNVEKESRERLQQLKGKETVTLGGRKIRLLANVGNLDDLNFALENDAEGIGLFRSEFLYIGRERLPEEEEQFQIYKQALQRMEGKKVIIRTLDLGADKKVDYLHLEKESNPALGYRAIRICLTQPDIFKTQLRALYRASVYGNLSIMYPMIISTEEVEAIKRITAEVKDELRKANIPFHNVEEGIMIETPAAVMISDELAKMVDFFSVGTNDLAQYALAVDRQNEKLDAFFDPHHKAVLKMIKMAADNAHKEGKWIGICGELGADTQLTGVFLDMGIDELSVAPSAVLKLRDIIRKLP